MSRVSVFIIQLCFISILLPGCGGKNKDLIINDLRCENLSEPLGIGTVTPLLSWKTRATANSTKQSAYQILAASEKSLLNEIEADLWNSGKVPSSESVLVPYAGNKLDSRSVCYWKIRIWNENDRISDWSDASFFSTGLVEESDWKADYIGFPDTSVYCSSPLLRKTFTLDENPEMLFIHVNSLGYHEVWVNGKKAGLNVLSPGVSQFSKRSLSITYDISSLVQKGRNDLIIWIGQGWHSKGLPGVAENGPYVKAQVEMLSGKDWKIIACTDSSWTGRKSGYSTTGTWRAGQFGGEQVEASMVLNDLTATSLDKTEWQPVAICENIPGEVTTQPAETNRIMETIKPESVTKLSDSVWLVDIGKTLTGWFEIRFPELIRGQKITLEFCDHLDEEGKTVNQGQKDIYISGGQESDFFCNKFNYHGFRYVKISNLATEPDREKIKAYLIHTGYNISSSFESSDPDLNKIHDMISYTLRCLSLGGYLVDCPQIERLGYGGDGNASTETAQTMFDLGPLYSNWLQAWADCIREDGGMPHTAPNPYPAGGGPYWCGFIITASWRTYKNYGDIRILEKYYPVMQKWLGYVDKYTVDGLLRPWPETDYRTWYLGDWATPEGIDQKNEASVTLVNNCFLTICYETMQKIASVLGKTTDAESYTAKTVSLKESIREKCTDRSGQIYGSGSQIDLTYPLLAGIVPDSIKPAVRKKLYDEILVKHNGHIATGLVGIPVFTEWSVKNREADLMYSILKKREYPGYLYMLDNGATTTWEHWNGARSRIHNCYNGIGSWFYQSLGGIIPDDDHPGYRHIIIDPQFPAGISWVNVTKETPYGTVSVRWDKAGNLLKMSIKIPVGCTASICIPEKTTSYTINGARGEKINSAESAESGEYFLECTLSE
jgi:alpha-L-rhamnosidase